MYAIEVSEDEKGLVASIQQTWDDLFLTAKVNFTEFCMHRRLFNNFVSDD